MLQVRGHVDPRRGLSLSRIVTESHPRLALREEEHGRIRRPVFGEFLLLPEAEHHGFHAIVQEDRVAQDAVRMRLCLLGEIEEVDVRGGQWSCPIAARSGSSRGRSSASL